MDKNQKLQRLVSSDGDLDAKIMIIGEAPGKEEEKQGKPFVGRAGKLLFGTLEKLGWQRSDFYVTNIVKYRPTDKDGKNRTPTDKEIQKGRLVVLEEIKSVKPNLIVLVGRTAMSGMGLAGTMAENRGKVLEKDGYRFLITYHPAAILRNINWEPLFRQDLSQIRALLQ